MVSCIEAAAPILGTAVNVAMQAILARAGMSLLGSIMTAFAVGLAVATGIEVAELASAKQPLVESAVILGAALLIYGNLGFLFFNFVNAGESSIRVRVLRDLVNHPDGIPLESLLNEYDDAAIFALRMDRLTGKGQIELHKGRYRVRRSFLAHAARLQKMLKLLLLRRRSEFD